MHECETISSNIPMRQGDIFRWSNAPSRDPWDRTGVILTADCDIAQRKTQDFYTYVPLITLEQYIRDVWAARKLGSLVAKKLTRMIELVLKFHRVLNTAATPLSETAAIDWMRRSTIEEILSAVSAEGTRDADELRACYRVAAAYYREDGGATPDFFDRLLEAYAYSHSIDRSRTVALLKRDSQNELRTLPQDVFFIGELPGLPEVGFLAMLRYIRPIAVSHLVPSFAEARGCENIAFRLGRLVPVMKYSVTQKFAVLFSRIGLPAEFEDTHDTALALTTESVFRTA